MGTAQGGRVTLVTRRHDSRGARGRGRPRSPKVDRAILDAALELLAERGVDGVTIEGIAARAGVSRPTLYRRWSTKEDLFADAIERRRTPVAVPDTGSLAGDLRSLFRHIRRGFSASAARELWGLALTIGARAPRFLERHWVSYIQPRRDAMRAIIARAQARGELSHGLSSEALIDLVSGTLVYVFLFKPSSPTKREERDLIHALSTVGRALRR
jgi:AcrR family transcriptional regulator